MVSVTVPIWLSLISTALVARSSMPRRSISKATAKFKSGQRDGKGPEPQKRDPDRNRGLPLLLATTGAKQDFSKGDGVGVVMGKTVHPRTEIGILQEADVSHAGRWFLGASPGRGGVSCVASAATAKWVT